MRSRKKQWAFDVSLLWMRIAWIMHLGTTCLYSCLRIMLNSIGFMQHWYMTWSSDPKGQQSSLQDRECDLLIKWCTNDIWVGHQRGLELVPIGMEFESSLQCGHNFSQGLGLVEGGKVAKGSLLVHIFVSCIGKTKNLLVYEGTWWMGGSANFQGLIYSFFQFFVPHCYGFPYSLMHDKGFFSFLNPRCVCSCSLVLFTSPNGQHQSPSTHGQSIPQYDLWSMLSQVLEVLVGQLLVHSPMQFSLEGQICHAIGNFSCGIRALHSNIKERKVGHGIYKSYRKEIERYAFHSCFLYLKVFF